MGEIVHRQVFADLPRDLPVHCFVSNHRGGVNSLNTSKCKSVRVH